MKAVDEYRHHAEECRRLAKFASESVVPEQLMKMAETSEVRAAEREAELLVEPDAPAEQRSEGN
jgi:hypothetical protein